MRAILIGSVGSSKVVLEEIIKVNFPIDMVYSLDEKYSTNVSGYEPIHELAEANNIPYRKFRKINDAEHVKEIQEISPDYIFVIGLSQLVKKDIISAAKKGVIGFHPTALPKYRGRAALVWQILLGVTDAKCSLFFIDEGIDSGDIIGQERYSIKETDYVINVMNNSREALRTLSNKVLPQIMNESIQPKSQNEEEATYLLKRTPEDGEINWSKPISDIYRLIRATSKPFPGAFSDYDGESKTIFWRAECLENSKYVGVPGQIANITDEYIDIVCIDGLLRVQEIETINDVKFIVGHKFK
ncbi:methionyl-tRNA formyltransferase [Halobacillus locisalis]|uniref:Methionyl-tRNA formyltransferase n=1 Tax=Halobacillus locisalis TaxID=220753 RepID=A0A838CTG0_9BACI|nr:methionyl-tRNA formyltransferase [Halobacillus locisalis]MBA2175357.1 methionyl-tRNA formyltransferase [Halobacillus locisalis]